MGIDLSSIRETIRVNEGRLKGNRGLTNELLIDDIMLTLGYNKKRDTSVRRVYGGQLDWEIGKDGVQRFAVKTVTFGEQLPIDVNESLQSALVGFDLLLITNGCLMDIYKVDINSALLMFQVNILDGSDIVGEILTNLSIEEYSYENIVKAYEETLLNSEKVNKLIGENINKIALGILGLTDYELSDNNKSLVEEHIRCMLSGKVDIAKEEVITEHEEISEYDIKTIIGLKEKIVELSNINSELQSEISRLKMDMELLRFDGEARQSKMAIDGKELLSTVKDNKLDRRSYVAVVNTKLFQHSRLSRFIGIAIEELYDIVGFKLMPSLFDGDIYKLAQPSIRGDININNKGYDINIDGLTEEEVLSKLVILFSAFEDASIQCKVIGADTQYTEEVVDTEEEDVVQTECQDNIISINLGKLTELIDTDGVKIEGIKYIGADNNSLYRVEDTNVSGAGYLTTMVNNVIDYMLASKDNVNLGMTALRKHDLTDISDNIQQVSGKKIGRDIISMTDFEMVGIKEFNDTVPIIVGISKILDINTSKIKVYLRGEIGSKKIKWLNMISENDIKINDEKQFIGDEKQLEEVEYTDIVVKRDIVETVEINKHSMKMQSDLFKSCKAIKTGMVASKIDNDIDIANVFKCIIQSSIEQGIEFKPSTIGRVIGTNKMILSDLVGDVTQSYLTIDVNGKELYISKMEQWQLVNALIKLNAVANSNKAIGLKVGMDSNAYEFYKSDYRTCEPTGKLAAKALTEYLSNKVLR